MDSKSYQRYWRKKNREHVRAYKKNYYHKNVEAWNARRREFRRLLRQQVIDKLGGKCLKCGISDSRVLQVDHVKGDGHVHRKLPGFSNGSTNKYLRSILADTTGGFQLLCANCNLIKFHEEDF